MKRTLIAAVALMAPTLAHAKCNLTDVRIVGGGVSIDYDPYDSDTPRPTDLPVRISGAGKCDNARIQMVVAPLAAYENSDRAIKAKLGGSAIDVTISSNSSDRTVAAQKATAFSGAPVVGRLDGSGRNFSGGLKVSVEPGQTEPAGAYRAEAVLLTRLLDEDGDPGPTVETPVFFDIYVKPSFRLAAGAERKLDVGELIAEKISSPVTFTAYSNVDYKITVRSDNKWRMLLRDDRSNQPAGVPYTVTLSGATGSPSGEALRFDYSPAQGDGARHQLAVKVGDVASRPAGDYRDFITVEIRAALGG